MRQAREIYIMQTGERQEVVDRASEKELPRIYVYLRMCVFLGLRVVQTLSTVCYSSLKAPYTISLRLLKFVTSPTADHKVCLYY
jgi:hypothetical protein